MEQNKYEKSVSEIIFHDIKTAYDSHKKEDIKVALDTVKKIKNSDGSLNKSIITKLKYLGVTFVWGKEENDTNVEKKLAAAYKGMAFQVD